MKTNRTIQILWRMAPIAAAAMIAWGTGCSNGECLENKNSLPLAGFYSSGPDPQAVTLDSLTIAGIGVPGDSILHDSVAGLGSTYLPFRIDRGETSYEIRYLSGLPGRLRVADTITFNYDIVPWFVSAACGAVYEYRMLSIETTHNIIDSVTCPGGMINNVNAENLRIYFRVSAEEEEE